MKEGLDFKDPSSQIKLEKKSHFSLRIRKWGRYDI